VIRSAAHLLWLAAIAWITVDQATGEAEALALGYIFPVLEDYSGEDG
jgi:hypothetical protein